MIMLTLAVRISVARDREPWVDWQDIPPTAESLNEVYAGIQTADAFLFITSSDFGSLLRYVLWR